MRPVSDRFLSAVSGPHQMVSRAIVVDAAPQYGYRPTGTEVPIIEGDVELAAFADVKSNLSLTIPGEYWDLVQPYGTEIYVERGVQYGNGEVEYAGLGYHRVEQVEQDVLSGPIQITAMDRVAQLQQNQLTFPIPINNGMAHRDLFELLLNGDDGSGQSQSAAGAYGAYYYTPIPVNWNSYDPDTTTVIGDQIVDNNSYQFMSSLLQLYANTMRFNGAGELDINSLIVDPTNIVATLAAGPGGVLSTAKRNVTRTNVHNAITSYGSDPSALTNFIIIFNDNPSSPLAFNRKAYPQFGPSPTYFDSPLLQTNAGVYAAAETLLGRYTALPVVWTCDMVCNPALEPNDVVILDGLPGLGAQTVVLNTVTIPLISTNPGQIVTRGLNALEGIEYDLPGTTVTEGN